MSVTTARRLLCACLFLLTLATACAPEPLPQMSKDVATPPTAPPLASLPEASAPEAPHVPTAAARIAQPPGASTDTGALLRRLYGCRPLHPLIKGRLMTLEREGRPLSAFPFKLRVKTDEGFRPGPGFPTKLYHHSARVMGIDLDLPALVAVCETPGIRDIREFSRLDLQLVNSVPATRADQVHSGNPSYRGQGVVIGVIDSGLDLEHLDLLDANGKTRVLYVWDQVSSSTTLPAPVFTDASGATVTGEGYECDATAIDSSSGCPELDNNGHGTHVAGIAAGDGDAGSGYVGMAPEARLVIVKITDSGQHFNHDLILQGIDYIRDRARRHKMPYVINLSLTGPLGPHDGCAEEDQDFDAKVLEGGSPLVFAAGNSANKALHATHTLQGSEIWPMRFQAGSLNEVTLDLWYDNRDSIAVRVVHPSGQMSSWVTPSWGQPLPATSLGSGNDRVLISNTIRASDCNLKNEIEVIISDSSGGQVDSGEWRLELTAVSGTTLPGGGTVHAWTQREAKLLDGVSSQATIGSSGSSSQVITVGSYITTDPWYPYWPECTEPDYTCSADGEIGAVSKFSAQGPLLESPLSTEKPDLIAPGEYIKSADAGDTNSLIYIAGTSQAAPHVTGAIALMLEKDPSLTPAELKQRLRSSADQSDLNMPGYDPERGFGKLDALTAVSLLPQSSQPAHHLTCAVSPSRILADGSSKARLTVQVVDQSGYVVDAKTGVALALSGSAARLVSATPVEVQYGTALFDLQSTTTPGTVTLSASASGLQGCQSKLEVITTSGPTTRCGSIYGKETWTLAGSPYQLTCDVHIEESAEVTIEPGVRIVPSAQADLNVRGTLWAIGTAVSPIVFESTTQVVGTWGGIVFFPSLDGDRSVLEHVDLRYGGGTSYAAGYPILMELPANPALSDLTFTQNRVNGVAIGGGDTLTSDYALDDPDVPYYLTGDLTVDAHSVLSIAPGVVLKLGNQVDIELDGGLYARGTSSDRILFTSWRDDSVLTDTDGAGTTTGVAGDWGGIYFRGSSRDGQSLMEHVTLRYGGNNTYAVSYPIRLNGYADPVIRDVKIEKSLPNAVGLDTGAYDTDFELHPLDGLAYFVEGDVTVEPWATLTIHPGTLIKMGAGDDFLIQGALRADGTTQQPIVFTSVQDDSHGGDSDGGGTSVGLAGDWGGIDLQAGSEGGQTILSHVEIYFAGDNYYASEFPIRLNPSVRPTLEAIRLGSCLRNAIGLEGGTYGADLSLQAVDDVAYLVDSDLRVEASAVLTLDPGVVLKLDTYTDLHIEGHLVADGSSTPIIFTSEHDDSVGGDSDNNGPSVGTPGDWGGIRFTRNLLAGASTLRGLEIAYAGEGSTSSEDYALVFDGISPRLEQSVISNSSGGIYITNGAAPDLGGGSGGGAGGNRFLGFASGNYAVRNNTANTIYARDNAWGVSSSQIPSILYDKSDSSDKGVIDYASVLTECTPGTTQTCGTETGACTTGKRTCAVDGTWGACSGIEPDSELCDGIDNDCDGQVDEALTQRCGNETGACAIGTQTCSSGAWGICEGAVSPQAEVCDGVDNDCDGLTDEALWQSCGSSTGECETGLRACVGGLWGACERGTGPESELCDGLDNDCDGGIDEDVSCPIGTAIEKCGSITSNQTWTLAGSPYLLDCDVTVKSGTRLTLEPGVTVLAAPESDLNVEGALWAVGTASQPITFRAADGDPGSWGGIVLKSTIDDANTRLEHVVILEGGSTSYAASYPIRLHPFSNPAMVDVTLEDNRINAILLETNTYTSNITLDITGLPYYLAGDLTIGPAAVLTIAPGVILKAGSDVDINIEGGMVARGTSQAPIIFTSLNDDQHGGASNGSDGAAGAPGDWGGIYFKKSTIDASAVLEYVEIWYGGSSSYAVDFPIRMSAEANPTLKSVRLVENLPDAVGLDTGSYSAGIELKPLDGLAYWLRSDLTVEASAVLTIRPGVILKLEEETDLLIKGGLVAEGTSSTPIIVTSWRDDSVGKPSAVNSKGAPGDWGGIYFTSSTNNSYASLKHVELRYGGGNTYAVEAPLRIHGNARPALSNLELIDCAPRAIAVDGTTYNANFTLKKSPGIPYWIDGDLTVGSAATLTIEPGAIFKMSGDSDIKVQGNLVADGSSDPIIFTSLRDDSIAGDTNNDGSSAGVPGDWGGIRFYSSSSGTVSLVRGVQLYYAGEGSTASESWALVFDGASPKVEGCTISRCLGGVYITSGGNPDLGKGARGSTGNNRFLGFTSGAYDYAVRNNATNAVYARGNYWETESSQTISGMVYDQSDNNGVGIVYTDASLQCIAGDTRPCGSDTGACQIGTSTCGSNNTWGVCQGSIDAQAEKCDGIDNNCDGKTDEDLGTLSCGAGACKHSVNGCVNGQTQVCDPYEGSSTEKCDSVDNDCDGKTDEDLGTLTCGVGACLHTANVCMNGQTQTCNPSQGATTEKCDGIDNDCDGKTDEDLGTFTCGSGVCTHTLNKCEDGQPQSCDPLKGASLEVCDGLDNDCDGKVDEDLGTLTCGVGACLHTVSVCQGGQTLSCDPLGGASSEKCDGIDNDCDGTTDEALVPPLCPLQAGVCAGATQVCGGTAGWQACSSTSGYGGSYVSSETTASCDGADNDCDGTVDEGCSCLDGATRTCGTAVGVCEEGSQRCSGGVWGGCEGGVTPQEERCDGIDNDCDGEIDDALDAPLCPQQEGVCAGAKQVCGGAAGWLSCDGVATYGSDYTEAESSSHCDGKDNDCDGTVDESCECNDGEQRPCGSDTGQCVAGVQVCGDGAWTACLKETGPAEERCDGLDNDCDGEIDEALEAPACEWQQGVCGGSVQLCGGQQGWLTCEETDGYGPSFVLEETGSECDGLDNDCDGAVDEGCECADAETRACGSETGECTMGMQTCEAGVWGACVDEVPSREEACDGLDNDCDGEVDEGCGCGDGEVRACGSDVGECEDGLQRCEGGLWGGCEGSIDPAVEACDGLDNDCNGAADEDCECSDGETRQCGSDVGECRDGTQACEGGAWSACDGERPPAEEACDRLDNDCDGVADEELSCPPDSDDGGGACRCVSPAGSAASPTHVQVGLLSVSLLLMLARRRSGPRKKGARPDVDVRP